MQIKAHPAVYGIYCTGSKKYYIGGTTNPVRRFENHRAYLRNNHSEVSALQDDWNLYGEHTVIFFILEYCIEGVLVERETAWVAAYLKAGHILYNSRMPKGGGQYRLTMPAAHRTKLMPHLERLAESQKIKIVLSDGRSFSSVNEFAEACGYRGANGVSSLTAKGWSYDEIARFRGILS